MELNEQTIIQLEEDFFMTKKSNPFYGKNVYFSEGLCSDPLLFFQLIGNYGGWGTNRDLSLDIDVVVLSDKILATLKTGIKTVEFLRIERHWNERLKKANKLKLLSERALISFSSQRIRTSGDWSTSRILEVIINN